MLSLDIERVVSGLVKNYQITNPNPRPNKTESDIKQDMRLVAIRAIRAYKNDKGSMLTSFVYECVKRHFIDEKRRRFLLVEQDETPLNLIDDVDKSGVLEWELTARVVLSDDEYSVYRGLVEGYSILEMKEKIGHSVNKLRELRGSVRKKLGGYL